MELFRRKKNKTAARQTGRTALATGFTFVIADDHPLFRGALREAVAGIGADPEILEAGDFNSLKECIAAAESIDLILLDLTMPGASGLGGLVSLRSMAAPVPVVVVSGSDDPETIRRTLDLGASGFISKSSSMDDMRDAIRTVLDGEIAAPKGVELGIEADAEIQNLITRLNSLTPQQSKVLSMLAEGLLNKQIAYELGVSEATIKAHVSAILQKLGVDSRTQAVIALSRIGSDPLSS